MNVCKFLDKKQPGYYFNTLMQIIKTYTNVNHSCPYTVSNFINIFKAFANKNFLLGSINC